MENNTGLRRSSRISSRRNLENALPPPPVPVIAPPPPPVPAATEPTTRRTRNTGRGRGRGRGRGTTRRRQSSTSSSSSSSSSSHSSASQRRAGPGRGQSRGRGQGRGRGRGRGRGSVREQNNDILRHFPEGSQLNLDGSVIIPYVRGRTRPNYPYGVEYLDNGAVFMPEDMVRQYIQDEPVNVYSQVSRRAPAAPHPTPARAPASSPSEDEGDETEMSFLDAFRNLRVFDGKENIMIIIPEGARVIKKHRIAGRLTLRDTTTTQEVWYHIERVPNNNEFMVTVDDANNSSNMPMGVTKLYIDKIFHEDGNVWCAVRANHMNVAWSYIVEPSRIKITIGEQTESPPSTQLSPLSVKSTPKIIHESQQGFDAIEGDVNVLDYMKENPDMFVIIFNKKFHIFDKNYMNKEWFNKKSRDNKIFYECRNLDTSTVVRETNIIREVPLFQLKTIGLYEYVTVKNFLKVLKSSARFFELIDTGKKFISVGSQNMTYENSRFWDALGASHCQEGQDGKLFKLVEVKTKELKKSDLEKLNRAFKKLQQKWRNTRKNR